MKQIKALIGLKLKDIRVNRDGRQIMISTTVGHCIMAEYSGQAEDVIAVNIPFINRKHIEDPTIENVMYSIEEYTLSKKECTRCSLLVSGKGWSFNMELYADMEEEEEISVIDEVLTLKQVKQGWSIIDGTTKIVRGRK